MIYFLNFDKEIYEYNSMGLIKDFVVCLLNYLELRVFRRKMFKYKFNLFFLGNKLILVIVLRFKVFS